MYKLQTMQLISSPVEVSIHEEVEILAIDVDTDLALELLESILLVLGVVQLNWKAKHLKTFPKKNLRENQKKHSNNQY